MNEEQKKVKINKTTALTDMENDIQWQIDNLGKKKDFQSYYNELRSILINLLSLLGYEVSRRPGNVELSKAYIRLSQNISSMSVQNLQIIDQQLDGHPGYIVKEQGVAVPARPDGLLTALKIVQQRRLMKLNDDLSSLVMEAKMELMSLDYFNPKGRRRITPYMTLEKAERVDPMMGREERVDPMMGREEREEDDEGQQEL